MDKKGGLCGKFILIFSFFVILIFLLLIPLIGVLLISTKMSKVITNTDAVYLGGCNNKQDESIALQTSRVFLNSTNMYHSEVITITDVNAVSLGDSNNKQLKSIALQTSICTLFVSLIIFALYDFSNNQYQFVQEYHEISYFNFYLGVDGLSIYFVLLTTIIMPVSLLSN